VRSQPRHAGGHRADKRETLTFKPRAFLNAELPPAAAAAVLPMAEREQAERDEEQRQEEDVAAGEGEDDDGDADADGQHAQHQNPLDRTTLELDAPARRGET
jgi:hypothetical protein